MPGTVTPLMKLNKHQQKITFDQVFDVIPAGTHNSHKTSTIFSFESGAVSEYGVLITGTPELRSGMTVTALFSEPGNWQTLIGWVDHDTGEVVCPPPREAAWYAAAVAICGMVICSGIRVSDQPIAIALFTLVFLATLRYWYQRHAAYRTLQKLAARIQPDA